MPHCKTAGVTTCNTEQHSIKTGEKWKHRELMSFMFRDWKEIYLTSTIPVLCYRALFLTFSKNSGRRVFFEDLRDVNRFFILTTNKYTKKQIHILDPLVCNTPSSSTEQKIPMALLVFLLNNIFWFCFETASCYFFSILPTPSTLFPVKVLIENNERYFPSWAQSPLDQIPFCCQVYRE